MRASMRYARRDIFLASIKFRTAEARCFPPPLLVCRAASYLNCMDIWDELLEEVKHAAITILAVAMGLGDCSLFPTSYDASPLPAALVPLSNSGRIQIYAVY
jgi:hypothetical protein